jgi:hypothetical protein
MEITIGFTTMMSEPESEDNNDDESTERDHEES